MGTPHPLHKRGHSPQIFGPCLLRPNAWMDEAGTWHGGRPQPGDFVLDGDPVPFLQKGAEPLCPFLARFYCGQTARCIKMPLGMDVGLSPGNFVLDGDPVLPSQQRGRSPVPIFGLFLLCPNGWMHQDATRYGSRPQPRRVCVRWDPALPQKG